MAGLLIAWQPWSVVWEETAYEPCHLLAAAETKRGRAWREGGEEEQEKSTANHCWHPTTVWKWEQRCCCCCSPTIRNQRHNVEMCHGVPGAVLGVQKHLIQHHILLETDLTEIKGTTETSVCSNCSALKRSDINTYTLWPLLRSLF